MPIKLFRQIVFLITISSLTGSEVYSGDLLDALYKHELYLAKSNYSASYWIRNPGPPEYITTRDRTRRQALTSDYLAEISQYDTVYLVSNPGPLYELFGVEETLVFGDNMIYYNNYSGEAPNRIKCRGKEPINEMTRIAVNPILTQYYSPTAESDYDYHNRSIMDATDHSRLIIAVRKDNGYEITSTEIIEEWLAGEPSYYKQLHDRILENAANGLYGCKEAPKTHGD